MKLEVLPDAAAVARRAAERLAAAVRAAVAARGRAAVAVSGGRTPGLMLAAWAAAEVPWEALDLFQVDERVAPAGDPDRNLTQLHALLLDRVPPPTPRLHPMPVEDPDLAAAAARYAGELAALLGPRATLDVVHLGLGADGHTASLVPGDPVLAVRDADVAATAPYRGRRRLTLTYPVLDRARLLLWVVTGAEKAAVLPRLLAGDDALPAGRVLGDRALVLADAAAARLLRAP